MGYDTWVNGIKDSILTVLKAGDVSFNDRIYADYLKKFDAFPVATVRLQRDKMRAVGPVVTEHDIIFRITVRYMGNGTETMFDSLTSYVGELVDIIEANRTFSNVNVRNSEIDTIEYSISPSDSAISYFAFIDLRVESIRHV